ncbi:cytochrome c3 family protein [Nitrosophilus alvini]|uniref:cytochrome c3 family protein n=1 Tax=Nitrosophilus alvini TaxID=2714855 RepID=UPI00190B7A2A|nr:cytochrome c3 family protein [Nitrosophilus alvini]
MRRNKAFALLLFVFIFLWQGRADNGNLVILFPKNSSIYDDAFASIVIKTDPKTVKKIEIYTDLNKTYTIATKPEKNIYCKSIRLKLGKNRIFVTAYDQKRGSYEKKIDLFYRSEVHEGADEAPYKYEKFFFHTDKNEKTCSTCHNMEPDKQMAQKKKIKAKGSATTDIEVLENPQDSNCYTCHNPLTSRKNGHAPSVNFMCGVCHTGKAAENNLDEEGKSKYLQPDPIMERCFVCHERIEKIMKHNRSDHGPTKLGRCNKCHNPHSSENIFFLRKPIWELCTTCHAEKATGKHVISSFVYIRNKGGHPTRGRPDPSRPGRELVCSSCHNPHGSMGPFLLRTKGPVPFSVCRRCHKK